MNFLWGIQSIKIKSPNDLLIVNCSHIPLVPSPCFPNPGSNREKITRVCCTKESIACTNIWIYRHWCSGDQHHSDNIINLQWGEETQRQLKNCHSPPPPHQMLHTRDLGCRWLKQEKHQLWTASPTLLTVGFNQPSGRKCPLQFLCLVLEPRPFKVPFLHFIIDFYSAFSWVTFNRRLVDGKATQQRKMITSKEQSVSCMKSFD